jgi:hypothetical protein
MTKKFITTVIAAAVLMPFLASAQSSTSTVSINAVLATTTPAHIFTACTQMAIEKRDTAIATSKTAYNNEMAAALNTRKEGEKAAVAIVDVAAREAAMKIVVEAYRTQAKKAQDALTKARKDIWANFEIDGKSCRDAKQAATAQSVSERKAEIQVKKASTTQMKVEKKNELDLRKASTTEIKAERKAEIEKKQVEIKTTKVEFKARMDALRDSLRSLWAR